MKYIWNMPKPKVAAGLPGEQVDHLVPTALEDVGGAQEDRLPHAGRRRGPRGERLRGGLDRAARVVSRARGRPHDGLAGERVAHVERGAVARGDPLPADEVERLADGGRRLCRLRHGLAPFEGQWVNP